MNQTTQNFYDKHFLNKKKLREVIAKTEITQGNDSNLYCWKTCTLMVVVFVVGLVEKKCNLFTKTFRTDSSNLTTLTSRKTEKFPFVFLST